MNGEKEELSPGQTPRSVGNHRSLLPIPGQRDNTLARPGSLHFHLLQWPCSFFSKSTAPGAEPPASSWTSTVEGHSTRRATKTGRLSTVLRTEARQLRETLDTDAESPAGPPNERRAPGPGQEGGVWCMPAGAAAPFRGASRNACFVQKSSK